jgi:hypothetical protein
MGRNAEQAGHLLSSFAFLTELEVLVYHTQPDRARSQPAGRRELLKTLRSAAAGLAVFAIFAGPVTLARPRQESQPTYSTITPAGYEVITLKPSGTIVAVLGLIECPEVEGARHVAEGLQSRIVSAAGAPLAFFPRRFNFRVTATLRKTILDTPSRSVATAEDPRQFILHLGFRLKVYDALEKQELAPQSVEQVGVPDDIAYDERVFRVVFDVGEQSITNRFVLEVFSPEGERLARFHFELL